MIPRKPDRVPNAKADTAEASGIPNARHATRKAAITP